MFSSNPQQIFFFIPADTGDFPLYIRDNFDFAGRRVKKVHESSSWDDGNGIASHSRGIIELRVIIEMAI